MNRNTQSLMVGVAMVALGFAVYKQFKPTPAAAPAATPVGDLQISPNGIPIGEMSDADRNFLHGAY